jgi:uncharacterized protein (TIGR02996 family)
MTDAEQAFLADIRSRPEDDAPRLQYADWLEENGRDVPCVRCHGSGVHALSKRLGVTQPTWGHECGVCRGSGRVSDGRREQAEFIAVQCELARTPETRTYNRLATPQEWHSLRPDERQGMRFVDDGPHKVGVLYYPGINPDWQRLRAREVELFKSASDWFRLPPPASWCLTCRPESETMRENPNRPWAVVRRGFVDEVRLATAVLTGGPCPRCGDGPEPGRIHRHGANGPGYYPCPGCTDEDNGERRGSGRTPGIAAALGATCPGLGRVVLTDREPYNGHERYSWWDASKIRENWLHPASDLPTELWSLLADQAFQDDRAGGKWYDTVSAATAALSAAALRLIAKHRK